MESSIATFLKRRSACELPPTGDYLFFGAVSCSLRAEGAHAEFVCRLAAHARATR